MGLNDMTFEVRNAVTVPEDSVAMVDVAMVEVLRLHGEGWTFENAYAHVHGDCDRAVCTGSHQG